MNHENAKINENLIASPVGVLSVHVKRASKILVCDKEKLGNWKFVWLRIAVDEVSKESKIAMIDFKNECKFDDLRHFLVRVHALKEDVRNELRLEFYAFGKVELDGEYYFRKLAHRYINVVDLLRVMHVSEEFEMIADNKLVAMLELEFCFSFGALGYGYSNQVDTSDPDKANTYLVSQERLAFSAFLRVKPPNYRKIKESEVTEVITVAPPKIFNLSEIVDFGRISKKLPLIYDVKASEFPLLQKHLSEDLSYTVMKNEFSSCRSRVERLEYLKTLMNNRDRCISKFNYEKIVLDKNT